MTSRAYHIPVMGQEVVTWLKVKEGGIYVDATFGGGGYTHEILASDPTCRVLAIDQDPDVLPVVHQMKETFAHRFNFFLGNFSEVACLVPEAFLGQIQGIVFDLGISSHQVDHGPRGFSFQKNGPLDMRMSQQGQTVADVIGTASEAHLADIFYHYGQEIKSRKIARRIVESRQESPITTTLALRDIIHKAVGKKVGKIDSATKTFQALRIYVNDECFALKKALEQVGKILAPLGRLVVVSFHSLEDGVVKAFLREADIKTGTGLFEILSKRVIVPSEEEVKKNPRARSARMRVASRTSLDLSDVGSPKRGTR